MKKHINIPIFVPHLGCPNDCVFCNQHTISGVEKFDKDSVKKEIENSLSTVNTNSKVQVAFFGGSFTGIDRDLMLYLLSCAKVFIDSGRIDSIRLSTRPDYIDEEILTILKEHGVSTIELGIQSLDDSVLALSKRGHTAKDSYSACKLIKEYGFELVGQMMLGLPGSTFDKELYTANELIRIGCNGVRIYPCIVFKDTELADMTNSGIYSALTEDEAIERSAFLISLFSDSGIPVIRIGLCSSESLTEKDEIVSGYYHSAFGELAQNRVYLNRIREKFDRINRSKLVGSAVEILVKKGNVSKAVGQHADNKNILKTEYNIKKITFKESENLKNFDVTINLYEKGGDYSCY